MIPNKRKTKQLTAADFPTRQAYYEYLQALADRPPLTEAQKLAQKENFALFQLKGIQSQLVHLMHVPGIGTINVEKIRLMCVQMEKNIKKQQAIRKNNNELTKANKKGYHPHG